MRSLIELNPDALAIARSLDRERKANGPRGPLHGIPVLIKDNIDTADKMQTTAGSLALVGNTGLARRIRDRTASGSRRDYPWQNQLERVGEFSFDSLHQRLERSRRSDEKSLLP